MKLPSAPLISIAKDGHVETRAELSWGPGRDNVTMEGTLREASNGGLDLTPMTVRSSALNLATPPMQPARRLEVAYVDEELLIIEDAQGAVDVLWREGRYEGDSAAGDAAPPVQEAVVGKKAATLRPPVKKGPEAAGAGDVGAGLPSIGGIQEALEAAQGSQVTTPALAHVDELADTASREAEQERFQSLAQDAAKDLEETWQKLADRQAAAEEQMEQRLGKALQAIDARLDKLDRWDPVAAAKKKLQKFEDVAEARLQKLDQWWEKFADQQAASEGKVQATVSSALEAVDTRMDELGRWDPVAEGKQKLERHQRRLREFEDVMEAKLEERIQSFDSLDKQQAAKHVASEEKLEASIRAALEAVDAKLARLDEWDPIAKAKGRLQKFHDAVEVQLKVFKEREQKLREWEATIAELEGRLPQAIRAVDEKLEEISDVDALAKDLAQRRMQAAVSIAEERLDKAADRKAKAWGQTFFTELRAESAQLEDRLDQHFQKLRAQLEEDARQATPGRGLLKELREEIATNIKEQMKQRRRWPWSS